MGCGASSEAPDAATAQQAKHQEAAAPAAPAATADVTLELLRRQDDKTSEAVIAILSGTDDFESLSASEGRDIKKRDAEDEVKLAKGIKLSVERGTLSACPETSPTTAISVAGKSAEDVAEEILKLLPATSGNVIVLQGLSGTGKGTTVKILQQRLPNCVCWSNGNVFRILTHLISEHCDTEQVAFDENIVTKDLVDTLMRRLDFKKLDSGFDVVVDGTTRVGDIQNTALKQPHISSRVPTVAERTQGEVISFAARAVEVLRSDGCNVILEGRAQTLQYIPSGSRFELVIANDAVLGQRRAAQRVMAKALELCKENPALDAGTSVADTVRQASSLLK